MRECRKGEQTHAQSTRHESEVSLGESRVASRHTCVSTRVWVYISVFFLRGVRVPLQSARPGVFVSVNGTTKLRDPAHEFTGMGSYDTHNSDTEACSYIYFS